MVGRVKVGVSSDSTQTTRTTAWVERESTQDKKSQRLLKLLTGFCIGQAIIVVASVVVLAILLNSNVSNLCPNVFLMGIGVFKIKSDVASA